MLKNKYYFFQILTTEITKKSLIFYQTHIGPKKIFKKLSSFLLGYRNTFLYF